jgi:hypothetical protein
VKYWLRPFKKLHRACNKVTALFSLTLIGGAGESKDAVKPDPAAEATDESAASTTDTKPDIKGAEGDGAKSDSTAAAPAASTSSEAAPEH